MRKTAFTLLLISLTYAVSAQVPGYQGKRFCVGYNASTFTVLDGGIGNFPFGLRLSYKTELSANYVVSRKASIGLSYYFAKQNYYVQEAEIYNNGFFVPQTEYLPCSLQMYELHMQFFRKNFVAPAGLYHQIGVGIVKYNVAVDSDELVLDNAFGSGQTNYTIQVPSDKFSGFKLSYHIGKTNPIGHNFYINTAVGVNFFQGGDIAYKVEKYSTTPSTYLYYALNKNIRKHNFAEIKIGFGWLAF